MLAPAHSQISPTPPSTRGRFPTPAKTHPHTPSDARTASPRGPDTSPRRLPPGSNFAEEPIPRLGTHPITPHRQAQGGPAGRGSLHETNHPASPTAEVGKSLMEFRVSETRAANLSKNQHIQLLGRCTVPNAISWTLATVRAHTDTPPAVGPQHQGQGYTSSQPLLAMADIPVFPIQH